MSWNCSIGCDFVSYCINTREICSSFCNTLDLGVTNIPKFLSVCACGARVCNHVFGFSPAAQSWLVVVGCIFNGMSLHALVTVNSHVSNVAKSAEPETTTFQAYIQNYVGNLTERSWCLFWFRAFVSLRGPVDRGSRAGFLC